LRAHCGGVVAQFDGLTTLPKPQRPIRLRPIHQELL